MHERRAQDADDTPIMTRGTPRGKGRRRCVLGIVALLLVSSCAEEAPSPPPPGGGRAATTPVESIGDGWTSITPREAGLDPDRLNALTAMLRRYHEWNVHAVLVEHDGRLAYEEYFTGMDEIWGERREWRTFDRDALHDVRSISKSVVSAIQWSTTCRD
jgi:hypothetical protein